MDFDYFFSWIKELIEVFWSLDIVAVLSILFTTRFAWVESYDRRLGRFCDRLDEQIDSWMRADGNNDLDIQERVFNTSATYDIESLKLKFFDEMATDVRISQILAYMVSLRIDPKDAYLELKVRLPATVDLEADADVTVYPYGRSACGFLFCKMKSYAGSRVTVFGFYIFWFNQIVGRLQKRLCL